MTQGRTAIATLLAALFAWLVVVAAISIVFGATCAHGQDTETPTATPTDTPTGTPTATPTDTPTLPPQGIVRGVANTPTPVPYRDEWVTTHRFQRACRAIVDLAPGAITTMCVRWPAPLHAEALGMTGVEPWCAMRDETQSAAALQVHHVMLYNGLDACAVVFNRDASAARSGMLCCWAYRGEQTE